MSDSTTISILDHFRFVDDPRNPNSILFPLDELLVIAFCSAICGFSSYCGMAAFAEDKREWLQRFLPLKSGTPSHDTFRRLFSLLDAKQFELAFISWMRQVAELTDGAIVAVDGKTIKGSRSPSKNKNPAHIVSAWACDVSLTIGHVKVEEKTNEISAIPDLLNLLYVKGCIVTIDAMGCQKEIVDTIVKKGGGFALAVKENQPQLKKAAEEVLAAADGTTAVSREKSRGREEIRKAVVAPVSDEIQLLGWDQVTHVGLVKSTRIVKGQATYEDRLYILRGITSSDELLRVSRQHWHVENKLHWVLDVTMGEDDCQVTDKNGERNLATLRRIAINKLRAHQGSMSMKRCQSRAALVDEFREKVLRGS